jgi:2-polyprenyl-3-methyl-5-hydroxy-6-metoxy-1,4-benzoquinol methylase
MVVSLKRMYRWLFPASPRPERLMYRVVLFDDLLMIAGRGRFKGKRILEIGPKDGLDSRRLASLSPQELVMIDLPEKREGNEEWLGQIGCSRQYIEANFMYMPREEYQSLGRFHLIWCTGVLYHNAEQLRFLRKLYHLLDIGGYLVLESATLRLARSLRNGSFVQIHYPETYRDTGTITHVPTASAIEAWLTMVGFREIHRSSCYEKHDRKLLGQRFACICKKDDKDEGDMYYGKSGLNPEYRYGDST